MSSTIEEPKYLYLQNTEISLEAVKFFVDEVFNDTHKIVQDKETGLRAIIPTSSNITDIAYDFTDEEGFSLVDEKGNDITSLTKVICFTSDTNENGNYIVQGIINGTLTISGAPSFTEKEIQRLVDIENTL